MKDSLLAAVAAFVAFLNGESFMIGPRLIPSANAFGGGYTGRARQTRTVISALVLVIIASLSVIVVDDFDQSLGTPSSTSLSTAQNDILSGFADMASLIGPLLLVMIVVVIIALVRRAQ